ncbi:hypothetical protein [Phyllobacterium pellucidum]|uniref:hypothetical protein n=1 Tax=Phyllobacterium pellucidum TaxID=2740464 RepID=UPI001D14042E|nr:hypothetical protein [Phyllobacterium sp. T1018]UGY09713.1 hypothetical protein LLE51_000485 [Phyllobacterium sp. T1018]
MWHLLKKMITRPEPPPAEADGEVMHFHDQGFTRTSHLTRSMGWRQSWSWNEVTAFGFTFTPAMFPDPWFGDYMESQWFFTVDDGERKEHIYFDVTWLDLDCLPPGLLDRMPDLDLDMLREGLQTAALGPRHFAGDGRWIGWQHAEPKPRRRKTAAPPRPPKLARRKPAAK